MPVRVTIQPNSLSLTPHRVTKSFNDKIDDLFKQQPINSLKNLRIRGNPFLMSKATKRTMRNRISAMYRLATPRTVKTSRGKLIHNYRCNFITLTLPSKQIHSDKEIKEQALNHLLIELRKHYGVENYVWKAELQKNQNIHFHIITDQYICYYALRRRWNRIINKLGYVDRYAERMHKIGFDGYHQNALKYNPKRSKAESLIKYKVMLKNGFSSPNSVDVKAVRNDKDIAIYMSKYMTKDILESTGEELDPEDQELLERGNAFGRSWFCSRSLSRLKTGLTFSYSEIEKILGEIMESEGVKFYSGDFFRVWFFRYTNLSHYVQNFLRGWLMHNAYIANYNYP